MNTLSDHISKELRVADELCEKGDLDKAFHHLERAHVLGQTSTRHHTNVHWRMLKLGFRRRDWREVVGQVLRIGGAATKTPFGIIPKGNTGGANVSPFRSMPIAPDLKEIIEKTDN
jgi:hypothetical protein